MARVIKLKESDITNIVRRILKEEKHGRHPDSLETIGRLDEDQMKQMGKAFLSDVNTIEEFYQKYTKIYEMSPDWAKRASASPDELRTKFPFDDDDDDPQALIWYWIVVKVIIYISIAWYLCCDFDWGCC